MRKGLLCFFIVFLVGCQAVSFPESSINTDNVELPEVSFFLTDSGTLYDSPRYRIGPAIYRKINDSGLFQRVTVNNTYSPLKIYISFRDTADRSGLIGFAKSMITALTLFLVPSPIDYRYEATYDVVFMGENIKSYSYSLQEDSWVHMFLTLPAEVQEVAAKSMTSQFLSDLSADKLSTLKSNDVEPLRTNGI
jgi:hypothetical protein